MNDAYWKKYWDTAAEDEDLHKQVKRTKGGQAVDEKSFSILLEEIDKNMQLHGNDVLLDLCCGNGLITRHLAQKCAVIIGVDFSDKLINQMKSQDELGNMIGIESDVTKIQFGENTFDKVLMYAGAQYVSSREIINLFQSVNRWL